MKKRTHPSDPEAERGLGLRLRIWFGCLAGALVSAAALWLAIGWVATSGQPADSSLIWIWLPVIATAGILVGLAAALWLDHGVVTPVRGFVRALRSGRVTELRGLPSLSGWGELSALAQELQRYLAHHVETRRAAEDLTRLIGQLEQARTMLVRWRESEQWDGMPVVDGPLGHVSDLLNQGLARAEEVREQNREASEQIRRDLSGSLEDAHESAEQTERGFVEATALLTTVRELQRLTGDLDQAGATPPGTPGSQAAYTQLREAAAGAITELVTASSESVEHLSAGLMRVRQVSEQVQLLGNRATLLALNFMVSGGRTGDSPARQDDVAAELKALAHEVRTATDRAAELTRAVERDVEQASARMRLVRENVAASLEGIPEQAPAPEPAAEVAGAMPADTRRLLDRVREMTQDATQKGERLSSAGERASRAAERLVRHLEESVAELEGLAVRLGPVEAIEGGAASVTPGDEAPDAENVAPDSDPALRLLGPEDVRPHATRKTDRKGRS